MLNDSIMNKQKMAQQQRSLTDASASGQTGVAQNSNNNNKNNHASEDEDDWGLVNASGILIVPGDDETLLSEDGNEMAPPTDSDDTSLMGNVGVDQTADGISVSISEKVQEHKNSTSLLFDPSIPSDIPSDLESLPDPMDAPAVSIRRTSSSSKPEHVTMVFPAKDEASKLSTSTSPGYGDNTVEIEEFDEKDNGRNNDSGLFLLRQELALADTFFDNGSNNNIGKSLWSQKSLWYAAVGVASLLALGSGVFVYEHRAWQASNYRLEERIEKLQLELIAKFEMEKKQELATLKQEFQQALLERELQAKQAIEAAVAAAAKQQQRPAEAIPGNSPRPLHKKYPNLVFDMVPPHEEDENDYKSGSNHYHFDNCWLQAEAKLGDCAQEAREVFRSKLQTLGRSLWSAQESFVSKVNDFGKRVQTVAREAAEHVLNEAEQYKNATSSSFEQFTNFSAVVGRTSNNSNSGNSFRSLATNLVSSAALASLAAVVADKAASYFTGLGGEQE